LDQGHDQHWLALHGDPERVSLYLTEASQRAALVGGCDPRMPPAAYIAVEEPSLLHALFLTLPPRPDEEQGQALVYPMPAGGSACTIRAHAIEEASFGNEAVVSASFDRFKLAYYDLLYFRNRARYGADLESSHRIRFGAIALRAYRVDEQQLEAMRASHELTALVPASVAYPEIDNRPDWHAFFALVKAAASCSYAGTTLNKLEVALIRTEQELNATLYVSAFAGGADFAPKSGEVIGGVLWLAGYHDENALE
jgi:hypothetical protein